MLLLYSFISQKYRHHETRLKKEIFKSLRKHIKNQAKLVSTATLNTINRSSISEYLVKL